jgi:hypothetical protein
MSALIVAVMPWMRLVLGAVLSLALFAMLRELEERDQASVKYRHTTRVGMTVMLTLAVCPWGWLLVPGWLVMTGLGYLVADPGSDDQTPMRPAPTRWGRFWQVLTGRSQRLAVWSAYVETVVLLLSIALYAYLLYHG